MKINDEKLRADRLVFYAQDVERLDSEAIATRFFRVIIPVWPSQSFYVTRTADGEEQRIKIPLQLLILTSGVLVFMFYLFQTPPMLFNRVYDAQVASSPQGARFIVPAKKSIVAPTPMLTGTCNVS